MFTGSIVWKGIVYALLMAVAKGLVSFVVYTEYLIRKFRNRKPAAVHRQATNTPPSSWEEQTMPSLQLRQLPDQRSRSLEEEPFQPPHAMALLVGFAMIARGEIGFLIASLSQSSGTLTLQDPDRAENGPLNDEIFLVIVWAVVLCTIIGPIGVGIIVRSQKKSLILHQN